VGAAHAFCFVGERFAGEGKVRDSAQFEISPGRKEEHMSTPARLQGLVEPIVTGLGYELFDLQFTGSTLSVLVSRPRGAEPGGSRPGLDLADLTQVSRAVSRALDEADPIAGHYSLEVSSPGLERPLRTPAHFVDAVGELVSIKTVATHDGPRRLRGELVRASAADVGGGDASIDVSLEDSGTLHTVPYADIERARTVFVWGPEPKPSKPKPSKPKPSKSGGSRRPAPDGDDPPEPSSRAPVTEPREAGHAAGGSATLHGPDAMINGDDKKVSAQ
jgi:ribosome maturation factor RimP